MYSITTGLRGKQEKIEKVAVSQGLWPNEADIVSLDYDWAFFFCCGSLTSLSL